MIAGAATKEAMRGRLRHLAYAGGWKKFEPLWDLAIRSKRVVRALPLLEAVLTGFTPMPSRPPPDPRVPPGARC